MRSICLIALAAALAWAAPASADHLRFGPGFDQPSGGTNGSTIGHWGPGHRWVHACGQDESKPPTEAEWVGATDWNGIAIPDLSESQYEWWYGQLDHHQKHDLETWQHSMGPVYKAHQGIEETAPWQLLVCRMSNRLGIPAAVLWYAIDGKPLGGWATWDNRFQKD